MATRVPVVNELKPGKSWSVYWELGVIPEKTSANTLQANATFTCGGKVYKVKFISYTNGCSLDFDFETAKGNG
jgi:hypothetical protein